MAVPFLVPRRPGRGRGGVGGRSETIRKSLSSELDGIKARSGEVDWPVRERSPSALLDGGARCPVTGASTKVRAYPRSYCISLCG